MRHLLKSVVLLVHWSLALTGTAHAEVYTSQAYGYSMEIPAGWEKTEFPDQDNGVVMVFHRPDGEVLIIRLVRESIDLRDETVRNRVLNDFLGALQDGGMEDIEIIDEGVASLRAGERYGMHYQYFLPDGIQVESVSIFVNGPDRYFFVTYAAVPAIYLQQIKDVAEVLASFKVLPREQNAPGGKYIQFPPGNGSFFCKVSKLRTAEKLPSIPLQIRQKHIQFFLEHGA